MYVIKRTATSHKIQHKGFEKTYFGMSRSEAITQFWKDYNENL